MDDRSVHLEAKWKGGYQVETRFTEGPQTFTMDEPVPVGGDKGPVASKVLAAALADCLTSSLLFCLNKSRAQVASIETRADLKITRNERGRFRVQGAAIDLKVEMGGQDEAKLVRCRELFEDFCIVTQSVRTGIPIEVTINGTPAGAPTGS